MKFRKRLLAGVLCAAMLGGCAHLNDPSGNAELETENTAPAGYGNSSGNITNYGSAVEYKGNIYCQYGDQGEKFARIEPDGKVDILKETMPYFINVVNDVIYYADANDGFRLHRMTTDGEGDQVVIDAAVYYVNIYNNYIYFASPNDEYSMYRANADGSETEKIHSGNCQYVTVYDGTIYFSNFENGGALYACGLDGSNERMLNTMNTMYINAYGNYLYYSGKIPGEDAYEKMGVYRQLIAGGEPEMIYEGESGDINVTEDKIYFTDWTENNIMRMDLDGANSEVYDENYGNYLNIAGGKIFCVRYVGDKMELKLNINDIKKEEEQ